MKKKITKMLSILMVFAMVFSFGMPALAAEATETEPEADIAEISEETVSEEAESVTEEVAAEEAKDVAKEAVVEETEDIAENAAEEALEEETEDATAEDPETQAEAALEEPETQAEAALEEPETQAEVAEDVSEVEAGSVEELQAALNSVQNGGTIKFTDNIACNVQIGSKSITLDLNGNTLSGQLLINHPDADVTVTNGTITKDGTNTNNATLWVLRGKATLNNVHVVCTGTGSGSVAVAVYDRLDMNGGTVASGGYGIGFFSQTTDEEHLYAQANLTGTNVTAAGNPISTNANGDSSMNVTLNGGTYRCTSTSGGWAYVGIYWASHGTLTIDGATVTSNESTAAGLFVKNGTIIIEDGNFTGTRDGVKITSEESNSTDIHVTINGGTFGGSRTGLYVKSSASGGANGNYSVTVKNGTFGGNQYAFYTSIAGFNPIVSIEDGMFTGNFSTSLTKFISGGTYTFDPEVDGLVADGYFPWDNFDGTWTVE